MMAATRLAAALLLTTLAVASAAGAATDLAPLPFVRGSHAEVVEARSGTPFVLALWSLDCTYCRHDLAMFGRLQEAFPALQLVLVATDEPSRRGEIAPALAELGVRGESWLFADPVAERLRDEIDRDWYGELPRTYFHDSEGGRIGVSGSLDEAAIRAWLTAAYADDPPTDDP